MLPAQEPIRREGFEAKVQFLAQLPPLKGLAIQVVRHMAPCFQLQVGLPARAP